MFVSSRRINTLATIPSTQRTAISRADEKTSLAWVRLYDRSPASYGVSTFDGYLELIPPKISLPYEKTHTLESAFDYINRDTFKICFRRSIMDAPVEIKEVELRGIREAKKADTKVKITMGIRKDLIGNFTAQDMFTKSKVSIAFNGGGAFQAQRNVNDITSL